MSGMLSALAWAPRGAARPVPKDRGPAAAPEPGRADGAHSSDEEAGAARLFGPSDAVVAPGEDPYRDGDGASGSEDSDEAMDLLAREDDRVLLTVRNEEELHSLNVWVYEQEGAAGGGGGNVFVSREVPLAAFPLAVEWLDFALDGGPVGHLCAVSTTSPEIEIFDLDFHEALEPDLTLGGEGAADGHAAAVLGLAWNREHRHLLASASADRTVKLWDLVVGKEVLSFGHHKGKVQSVAFNPRAPSVVLSGGFDRQVVACDLREPRAKPVKGKVGADVESVAWDPAHGAGFFVAAEDGVVEKFDARVMGQDPRRLKPVWHLQAHERAATSLALAPGAPGLLATGSVDHTAKVWDVGGPAPAQLAVNDFKAGAIFACSFCPDSPFLLAVGGAGGEAILWDTATEPAVAEAFGTEKKRRRGG